MFMRLYAILQFFTQRPVAPVVGSASVSVGSAWVSWFETSLPIVQWIAGVLAVVSAVIAILLGVRQLWRAFKTDFFGK